jgi:hypothetical protein
MSKNQEPVVLELAPLPREQIGPFLLLGLDKDADKEQIEANWAERVKWARKNLVRTALEDINWAREVLNDADRRVRADAASLNADTGEGVLRNLVRRYTGKEGNSLWRPLDVEKPLADYVPPTEVPDVNTVLAGIAVPEVPQEVPMVTHLLERLVREPLDPWGLPEMMNDEG